MWLLFQYNVAHGYCFSKMYAHSIYYLKGYGSMCLLFKQNGALGYCFSTILHDVIVSVQCMHTPFINLKLMDKMALF